MQEVYINLGIRSYSIYVDTGLLPRLGEYLKVFKLTPRVLLITNPVVGSLYGAVAETALMNAGFEVIRAEIPDGEEYKNLATAEKLYDLAYTRELDRRSPVVALGGGVVGDLAGFVAATYLRGVPFIQVPTTLLAQVDSSVGGKVAVNHPRGKNIIGAFYQPRLVLADLDVLKTLDLREVRAGLAEVIKYGVIADRAFFVWLEENLERLLALEAEPLAHAVAASCRIKARVVQEDETEQGRRAILNFGHTLGHALEALTGYTAYRHGEAVAMGMAAAARLAVALGMFPEGDAVRVINLIRRAGLPVEIPPELSTGDLVASMRRDKKVLAGRLTFVLPVEIGRVEIVRDVPEEAVGRVLRLCYN
ncbi:3-dehydroquinate synthase [Desulfofundulus thermosubterraneus]|uniref:3-dehydroquinate synthase n=1 Tax=Desulfofundulus thermosubterraneus DSM 16057 TaxID=1121432 RepID=A0A1M6GFB4_9FIRM|nr:3-dehydroquinate synthase [Desulfofundulus thermosubterraneus]SHJ08617.1 3-dehydroquinate synthase [Desulfofundulus thermosubterraneus DSM 16057]